MSKQIWVQVIPIPDDTSPPGAHPELGEPSQIWDYRDSEGQTTGLVYRFNRPDRTKEYRPIAYFRNDRTGRCEWRWHAFDILRPLYGLDRLALRPEATVLVVEGEKSADAADKLVGEKLVCISWPGGSKAVGSADFTPLQGRRVIIWPDNDEPGFRAALMLAKAATKVEATQVMIVAPPAEVRNKWDLANALEEGWDFRQVMDWISQNSLSDEEFMLVVKERFPAYEPNFRPAGNQDYSEEGFEDTNELDEDRMRFLPFPQPFPLKALPETCQEIIIHAARAFVVPCAIPATALLALASTCIGRSRGLSVKPGWIEYSNLYIALVAKSGTGKTPCTQAFFQPLYDIEQECYQRYKLEIKHYNQRVEKIKRDKDKRQEDLPDKPQLRQHYIDDATIESVSDALAGNHRGVLWFQDELAGLLKSMGRYTSKGDDGSIKSRLNSAHGCGPWKVNRKINGVVIIRHSCLSIFGTIQPKVLPQIFSDQDAVSGFLPRFLFVRTEAESPQLFTEDVFGEHQQAILRQLTRKLLRLDFDDEGKPIIIELGAEAKIEYVSWQDKLAKEQWSSADGNLIESCLAKLRAHCLRLCLILHVLEAMAFNHDETEPVSAETMRRAIVLTDWLKIHQKQVMKLLATDRIVTETSPLERRVMAAILALENEIEKGMLTTSRITEKLNEAAMDAFKITTAVVGKCCRKLSFITGGKMADGKKRGVKITEKALAEIRNILNPTVQSVQPVQNAEAERVSSPDSMKNCCTSRLMEIDRARTAGTEREIAVRPAEACHTKSMDRLDGKDGSTTKVSKLVEPEVSLVQIPPGDWVPFSVIDRIKDKKRKAEIALAFLHGKCETTGIVKWVHPKTRDTFLRQDTLPELFEKA